MIKLLSMVLFLKRRTVSSAYPETLRGRVFAAGRVPRMGTIFAAQAIPLAASPAPLEKHPVDGS